MKHAKGNEGHDDSSMLRSERHMGEVLTRAVVRASQGDCRRSHSRVALHRKYAVLYVSINFDTLSHAAHLLKV